MKTVASRTRRERGQAMPSVVAVVSVVAIVAAMVAFFAGGTDPDTAAEAQAPTTSAPTTPAPATPATRTPGPKPTAEPDPSPRSTPDTADRERKKNKQRKQRDRPEPQELSEPRAEPEAGAPDAYIEVYNNTDISGLAASTAAQLQDGGWQVVGVDNWYGDIPASTVYHPAGLSAEAQQLAQTLGIDRVRGAVAPMKFDRLTVILTPDAA